MLVRRPFGLSGATLVVGAVAVFVSSLFLEACRECVVLIPA
jgi:uncharacterized membrane protein YhfC